jgi:ABC-type polysaccharide/polyol phosphate transport system ATPase subunit
MIDLVLRRDGANPVSEFWALQGVSLTIWPGERLGIVGANGAGKSTLLRVLAKIYPPTSGRMVVRGKIAPLIEMGAGMNGELSGGENIFLNGALLGFTRQEMRERVDRIWEFSGLREFADLPLKYYSSGMYSRLAFAIATEVEPEILLIDEALSAGDAAFLDRARERMEGLFGRSKAVVLVSHDLKSVASLCTRAIWLHRGKVVAEGPVGEVVGRYSEFMHGGCDPALLERAAGAA